MSFLYNDLTVYIIDDDEAIRESMAMLMRSKALRAEVFSGAQEFLEKCNPESAGCLLVDVRMPKISGLELQQLLSAQGYSLPVIVMTGHGDVALAVQAMKAGAIDFIEKPFDEATLLTSIHLCLQKQINNQNADVEAQKAAQRLAQLSPREHDVFKRLAQGLPNKVIASELNISSRTVEAHRAKIMEKLGAKSLADIVRLAFKT